MRQPKIDLHAKPGQFPNGSIALGIGAQANRDLEFVLVVQGVEGRVIMTPEEHKVISRVLRRMEFRPPQ